MIRIVLADDHELVRQGVRRLLEDEPDFIVTAEASSSTELLELVRANDVDVVVLDISMPGPDILEVLLQLQRVSPGCRAIVLSMHAAEDYAVRVMRAGAAAFLGKDTTATHLAAAIRRAHEGGRYVTPDVGELLTAEVIRPQPAHPLALLSPREREVLRLLSRGHTSKRIAAMLQISPKSVSTYRRRLVEKLGVGSTAELVRYVITHGLDDV